MGIRKYKYYFKKPKNEIVKDILYWLMISGAIAIAATSPFFLTNLLRSCKKWRKYPRKKLSSVFYRLKKQGLLKIEKKNFQIYISLTREGKRLAGIYQINDLEIKKPKKWDGKWRILIFDISELKRTLREAFRGMLKKLGFYQIQKSVWIHPFECKAEVELLKDFFGLSDRELRLIVAEEIGDDREIRRFFNIP